MIYKQFSATDNDIYKHLLYVDKYFSPYLSERKNLKDFSKKISNNAITFEAWENNNLVGLVSAYFNDFDNRIGYINHIATFQEYRRCKISSKLLNLCIKYGITNNFHTLKLEVSINNKIAIDFYLKYGFKKYIYTKESMIMKRELI